MQMVHLLGKCVQRIAVIARYADVVENVFLRN